jgi:hypothetical protein
MKVSTLALVVDRTRLITLESPAVELELAANVLAALLVSRAVETLVTANASLVVARMIRTADTAVVDRVSEMVRTMVAPAVATTSSTMIRMR